VIASGRGLAGLAFADPGEDSRRSPTSARWPRATMSRIMPALAARRSASSTQTVARRTSITRGCDRTDFEVRVGVAAEDPDGPRGLLFGYRDQGSRAEGSRAVGAAVGKTISSWCRATRARQKLAR